MTVRPAKIQISLGIRPVLSVFAVRMKKAWVLSYLLSAQRRLWSDWADAQADLSLRWAHSHFVGFDMLRLICFHYDFTFHISQMGMIWLKISELSAFGSRSTILLVGISAVE